MKHIMKQQKVDDGQVGGLIQIFSSSLVILAPFSFIGIVALNYDKYIKYWIDVNTFITISIILFIIYEWIFYVFIFPSITQFGNRQAYTHKNMLFDEVIEIKHMIKEINSKLEKEKS